jgi:uncharacterized membrane protein
MFSALLAYVVTLAILVALDLVWLGQVAKPLYSAEIGAILRKDPNFVAAGAFYLLYAGGLTLFAVMPGLKAGSAWQACMLGAALGLVAYGTYDLTNLSVINGYTLRIALIDIAWGVASSAVTAGLVGLLLAR